MTPGDVDERAPTRGEQVAGVLAQYTTRSRVAVLDPDTGESDGYVTTTTVNAAALASALLDERDARAADHAAYDAWRARGARTIATLRQDMDRLVCGARQVIAAHDAGRSSVPLRRDALDPSDATHGIGDAAEPHG